MNAKKWIIISSISIFLILCILGLLAYHGFVHESLWKKEAWAEKKARAEGTIAQVDDVQPSVWDEEAWIVSGKDKKNRPLFVFVTEKTVTPLLAEKGISFDRIQQKINSSHRQIVSYVLSKWGNRFAWQVLTKMTEADSVRYTYEFYDFSNGKKITAYKLPSR